MATGEAKNRPRLFVSHHSSKAAVALQVEAALARHDVDCWMAPRDVDPGEAFDTAIQKAIDECSAVLLLFCAQSDKSRHVKRELILADSASKAILPLRLEDVVPHDLAYHLASAQWIDWLAQRDEAIARIAAKAYRLDGSDQPGDVVAAADALDTATLLKASHQEEPARMLPPSAMPPSPSAGTPVWVFAVIGLVLTVGVFAGMLLTRGGENSGTEGAAGDTMADDAMAEEPMADDYAADAEAAADAAADPLGETNVTCIVNNSGRPISYEMDYKDGNGWKQYNHANGTFLTHYSDFTTQPDIRYDETLDDGTYVERKYYLLTSRSYDRDGCGSVGYDFTITGNTINMVLRN